MRIRLIRKTRGARFVQRNDYKRVKLSNRELHIAHRHIMDNSVKWQVDQYFIHGMG